MNIHVFVAILLAAVVVVTAAPSPVTEAGEVAEEYVRLDDTQVEPERADRHRRVTCDLLSFKGLVGDSACAANCLSMGKAGGHCSRGVCQCRKTTIGKLWNDRFG